VSDATCPHCNTDFDVQDHYESGDYDCPSCEKTLWIEVDHITTYQASCLGTDHDWVQPGEPFPDGWLCTKCGTYEMGPIKKN